MDLGVIRGFEYALKEHVFWSFVWETDIGQTGVNLRCKYISGKNAFLKNTFCTFCVVLVVYFTTINSTLEQILSL